MDVDLGRAEIHVHRSWDQHEGPISPKSKAGIRTVPVLAVLRDRLDACLLTCRHTFASLLIDAGVNPKAIQEFMGHATIEETFSRYGHLMPGTRNQARELVDAYMTSAMTSARV